MKLWKYDGYGVLLLVRASSSEEALTFVLDALAKNGIPRPDIPLPDYYDNLLEPFDIGDSVGVVLHYQE